jgi:hypothetical protein
MGRWFDYILLSNSFRNSSKERWDYTQSYPSYSLVIITLAELAFDSI